MIGKIVKGKSFGGCVNYVLKEEKSRLLEAVGVEGSPSEMAEQFELQTLLNDKVKNTVGHISLNFSAEDAARLATDDKLMLKIAHAGLLAKFLMLRLSIHTAYFISLVIPLCPHTFGKSRSLPMGEN